MKEKTKERMLTFLGWTAAILLSLLGLALIASSGLIGLLVVFLILTTVFSVFFIMSSGAIIPRILVLLGTRDVWWSPVRLLPSPGDISFLVKGTLAGPLYLILHNVWPLGWYYRKGKERFYKLTPEHVKLGVNPEREGETPFAKWLREEAGVAWVGFNCSYHRRVRRYDSYERAEKGMKWGVVDKTTKEDESHIFHFSTTMAVWINEAPAIGFYPVSFAVTWNNLMLSPILAEFRAGKWEVQATSAVLSRAREYVASRRVDQLRTERDTHKLDDFVDTIMAANFGRKDKSGKLVEGENTVKLQPEFGIKIEAPQLVEPDFESGDVAMTNALREQEIARANVVTSEIRIEEERNKGRAEAERRKEAAPGIREEWAARMSDPNGVELSKWEAVRESKPRFISLGNEGRSGVMIGVDDKEDKEETA